MLPVVAILAVALALAYATGLAVAMALEPGWRIVRIDVLPLGLATLLAVFYPLGRVVDMTTATAIVVACVVLALSWQITIRWRAEGAPRARGMVSRGWITTACAGLVVAIVLLVPVLVIGFPTTLAIGIADVWGYATLIDWFADHTAGEPSVQTTLADLPQAIAAQRQWDTGFATGFERFGASVGVLTGREGYQIVAPAMATFAAAGVAGWAAIARAVTRRPVGVAVGLMAGVAALSPLAVVDYAEAYGLQFVSLALFPFAAAAFIELLEAPSARTGVVAVLGVVGIASLYATTLVWLVPAMALLLVWRLARDGRPDVRRSLRLVVVPVAIVSVAAVAVSVLQIQAAVTNLDFVSTAPGNPGFPTMEPLLAATFSFGSKAFYGTTPDVTWSEMAGGALVAIAVLVALGRASRWVRSPRGALIVLTLAVVAVTAAAAVYNMSVDHYGYGTYKTLLNGGAIVAGAAAIATAIGGGGRWGRACLASAGVMAAVWIPVSLGILEAQYRGFAGFRAEDIAMGRTVAALPEGDTLLVEGNPVHPEAGWAQMMGAYMIPAFNDRPTEGLGTSSSYVSGGGEIAFRPDRPWNEVLRYSESPVVSSREQLWVGGPYTLERSAVLDLTPWGPAWHGTESEEGDVPAAWTSGPVDVVLSNRGERGRRAVLAMEVLSAGIDREVTASPPDGEGRTVTAGTAAWTGLRLPVVLPPRSTVPVSIVPSPADAVMVGSDPRPLVIKIRGMRLETPSTGG